MGERGGEYLYFVFIKKQKKKQLKTTWKIVTEFYLRSRKTNIFSTRSIQRAKGVKGLDGKWLKSEGKRGLEEVVLQFCAGLRAK